MAGGGRPHRRARRRVDRAGRRRRRGPRLPRACAPRPVCGRGHRRRRRCGPGARSRNRLARRGRRARAAQPSATPQRPALDDPARAPPRRAGEQRPRRAGPLRPAARRPGDRRPRARPARPGGATRARPARREGERRACPGDGLRAGHPGVGLGGQARDRRHERPCDRGRARHRGAAADVWHVLGGADRRRRRERRRDSARARPAAHPAHDVAQRPVGRRGRPDRLSPERAAHIVPRPGRPAGDGARTRGLRRQRAAAHGRAAPRQARARRQRRPGGRPPRPGRRDDVRGRQGGGGGFGVPLAAIRDALASARGRVSSGPCIG